MVPTKHGRSSPKSGSSPVNLLCRKRAITGSRRRYSITCWCGRAADVDCLCCNLVNPHYERIGRFVASYDAINYLPVLHHQLTRCTATFASMQTSLGSWLCVINNALESVAEKSQLSKIDEAQPKCFELHTSNNTSNNIQITEGLLEVRIRLAGGIDAHSFADNHCGVGVAFRVHSIDARSDQLDRSDILRLVCRR